MLPHRTGPRSARWGCGRQFTSGPHTHNCCPSPTGLTAERRGQDLSDEERLTAADGKCSPDHRLRLRIPSIHQSSGQATTELPYEGAELHVGRRFIESGVDGLQNLPQLLFGLPLTGRSHRAQPCLSLDACEVPILRCDDAAARTLLRKRGRITIRGRASLVRVAVYLANHAARAALISLECGACTDWTR